jgi:hypothetical protein
VTYNTIFGLSLQGPSWHVLPHAAPGFFVGRGCTGRWSSPNFASILLASGEDTLALHSGGRTQSHGKTILSTKVAMVLSKDLASRRVLGAYLLQRSSALVAIHCIGNVAALSGHCWHVDRAVFVCYQKLWHVCSSLDDTFSDSVS